MSTHGLSFIKKFAVIARPHFSRSNPQILRSLFLTILLLFTITSFAANKAIVLEINGPIGPATQDYFERGIAYAKDQQADGIILILNTPGGLETSMRGITEAIIKSPVPVITYVSPSGARAASAGVFILYSSHISAMAPGTNIGAASPVNLLGAEASDKLKQVSVEEKKAMNDAAAYVRSLAQLRNRNAEWAELAVRDAASITATEALDKKVIDVIANDNQDLLQKVNGTTLNIKGNSQTLNTTNWQLESKQQDWRYQFLSFITNPNIAYLLMLLAIYGIFFELYNPGLILPGVAGAIALLIVLYAFQLMPINYTGLLLILLGIAFMILELYVTSYGVIGIGGVIAFIIGSVMLFDMNDENFRLSWTLVGTMSALSLGFFLIVINLAIKAFQGKIVSGKEGLIGAIGVVITIKDSTPVVRVQGELWDVTCSDLLKEGDHVIVKDVDGLMLLVEVHTSIHQK